MRACPLARVWATLLIAGQSVAQTFGRIIEYRSKSKKQGVTINLDRKRIYVHCPRCNFWARPFFRQIRHRETIICGGCKANIRLDDHLGGFRKAQRQVNEALEELKGELGTMTINIKP
jgi:hypothetical protein